MSLEYDAIVPLADEPPHHVGSHPSPADHGDLHSCRLSRHRRVLAGTRQTIQFLPFVGVNLQRRGRHIFLEMFDPGSSWDR